MTRAAQQRGRGALDSEWGGTGPLRPGPGPEKVIVTSHESRSESESCPTEAARLGPPPLSDGERDSEPGLASATELEPRAAGRGGPAASGSFSLALRPGLDPACQTRDSGASARAAGLGPA